MECKPTCVVWFLLLCLLFAYHQFSYCNAQETTRSCTSPCDQCNFTFVCDPPPPAICIRENIALGKQVNMSSDFTLRTMSSHVNAVKAACLVFDGYRNTQYMGSTSYKSPDCIHTYNNDEEWVQVDLGRNYTITDITVYRRNNDMEIHRLANILITVDSRQCYQFPADVTGFPIENRVRCTTPLTGSIVRLSTRNQYLNLCEIEIWVCTSGRYGELCDGVCHCRNNAICDNYYGTCLTGCDMGYYGFNCSQQCGHCSDQSQCNASGHCLTGCQPGWQGPKCDFCQSGFFGPQCRKCGNCRDTQPCNSTTGICSNGCADGYAQPMCNETCRLNKYGPNCILSCGLCKSAAPCNAIDGSCLECETNFLPPLCRVCQSGFFGPQCTQKCGKCNSQPCNFTTGACSNGCDDGYEIPFCNETCRNKTFGPSCSKPCGRCKNANSCDVINGSCTECEMHFLLPFCKDCKNGFYGADCNKTCSYCNLSRACSRDNGTCLDGCADGYEPPYCKENCSSGMWGRNCENACGACLGFACRHDNGVCENGCFSGYEGEHCTVLLQQTNDRDLTGVIAGSVVGAGLLIGGSIVTAVLIWLRRSTSKDKKCPQTKSKGKETQETSNDNNATENLNFPENVYDKFESREDVSKPYTMLQKDNHDDCGKHSTTLDSNYENYATQHQNTPDDS